MTSDRWGEIERIYHDALDRTPGERPAFIENACGGDDAMKREIWSLLEHEPAADAFLERPALEEEARRFPREPRVAPREIDGYEILTLVGAGGMGEVFRARDLTLGREVAIKVLARSAAGSPGDLRRFEEEARLASSLNHPNIVTIYGVGEKPDFAYIAMELVRGRTLRALLAADRISVRRALDLAVQLADALAAAHANGIVHRDLKPENLMVTPEGLLKVLDFGIAKLQGPAPPGMGASREFQTEDGRILGTVGYMSPEQAAGRTASHASDQFALGTILYEMVTGERAWKRDTAAETLAAIIREDPPPMAAASPATPVALRWIVDRCLAKDPERRYASTHDLARDLTTLRDRLGEVSEGAEPTRRPGPGPRTRRGYLVGALALAALAAGILLAPLFRPTALPKWTQVGFRRGIVWSGRFAPDGQTLVYSAAWEGEPQRIFSTRPGSTATRTLELPPGKLLSISAKSELAFLRNTRFATFFYQPGTLARAGLEGGVPRDILEDVEAADWSADGTQLAVARRTGDRVRLEYPIGKTLYETDRQIGNVRISRDGAWIAFSEGGMHVTVSVLRVSDRSRRVLSDDWFHSALGLAWSADGSEVWFTPQKQVRDESPPLLAVTLAGKLREVVRGPGQLHLYDIAPDGRVLLARWDLQVGIRGSAAGASQDRELSATDDSLLADLSRDGREALFYDRDAIYLRALDGSPPLRIGEGYESARLSPDGKWVLTVSYQAPRYPVLIPVGAGDIRRIETVECEGVDWFPDGRRILCQIPDPEGPFRMLAIELASGKATEIPIAPAASDFQGGGSLSPDGSFLAGAGRGGDVLLLPLDGGELRRFAGASTGLARAHPAGWTADGRSIFLYQSEVPSKVLKLDVLTGRSEPWKELALQDPAGVPRISPVLIAPDGLSWAYGYVRVLSNLYVVEGLK